ncbi:hypothetical protein C482_20076 [Natrialba chahannaoensis JCM 10990]|uniref:Uncharacterized protein n=1 Tax=Natrialba chahannaoensis JCM 10990 TaxID=1227492 RepID=M0A6R5_9EURY|nr:hypothetical protein [Natrialba chahannaoensis]ELY93008.1 hypothetical protein C482_20076 [Natrialba chahannaoensis JCM 10990]
MVAPEREQSRIAGNRMAVVIAASSIVLALLLALLWWYDILDALIPEHGLPMETLPFYLLAIVVGFALLVWGWQRVLGLLE